MQLLERFLEPVNCSGSRFEHHDDLGLVGELVLPPVKRSRGGQDRAACDQPSIEQGSHELGGFVSGGEGGKNDDGVGVAQVEVRVKRS